MTSAETLQHLRELLAKTKDCPADARAREESFVYGILACDDPMLSRETVVAALRTRR